MEWLDGASAQHLVGQYGYGAIFVIVMLESAGIPMPGETILVTAAVYAGTRHALDIRGVIAAAAGGAILGDNIGFWVGREFGEPLLDKWGHFIGLDARKRALGRYLFARYGGLIVFFGRFVALLRAFAALLAGANGLAPRRFFAFNAAGGIVWATTFGLGGYLLGAGIHRIAGPVGWAATACGVRPRVRAVALLQEARGEPPGQGRGRDGAARALNRIHSRPGWWCPLGKSYCAE